MISLDAVTGAIAQKMVRVIRSSATAGSPPRLFHGRSSLEPRVMKLFAQVVTVLQLTRPWFLTHGKMRQCDSIDGASATIFALVVGQLRQAAPALAGIVAMGRTHVVPRAHVQLHGPAGMKDLEVVGHEALKGHGTPESTRSPTPSSAIRPVKPKVTTFHNRDKVFVDRFIGPQDGKAALGGFDFPFGIDHAVVRGIQQVDAIGNGIVGTQNVVGVRKLDHGGRSDRSTIVIQKEIKESIHWFQYQNVEIEQNDNGIFYQCKGFEFDEFLFSTAPILDNLVAQFIVLNVLHTHWRSSFLNPVPQVDQRCRTRGTVGMIKRVEVIVIIALLFSISFLLLLLVLNMNRMFQNSRTFRNEKGNTQIRSTARNRDNVRHGVCDCARVPKRLL